MKWGRTVYHFLSRNFSLSLSPQHEGRAEEIVGMRLKGIHGTSARALYKELFPLRK